MTSGPGITGKIDSPDDAIEEISGLLEMDELKGREEQGETEEQSSSEESGKQGIHVVPEAVSDAIDVAMETPGPVKLDPYLPPPPVSEESPAGEEPPKEAATEGEAAMGSNMAYEDLLEKLVLPAQPPPAEDPATHQVTPGPSATPFPSPPESLFPLNATPAPVSSDERTVVTVNPLLAEEQEAAARAEKYVLPAAPPPQPLLPNTPVVAPKPPREAAPLFVVLPGKQIQASYSVFGGIVLVGVILGVLIGRAWAPTHVIEKIPVTSLQPVVSQPVVPVQAAQPANPPPQVIPMPQPSEAPRPAAQPASAEPAVEPPAVQPVVAAQAEETTAEAAVPEARPSAQRAPKASRPARPAAARPAAAPKPATAPKPAGGKKPAKGWVDPFAS